MLKDNQKSKRFATLGRIQKTHGKDGEVLLRLPAAATLQASSLIEQAPVLWLVPPPKTKRNPNPTPHHNPSSQAQQNTPNPSSRAQQSAAEGSWTHSKQKVPNEIRIRFEGVTDRTAARDLVGRDLLVERTDIPAGLLETFDQLQEQNDNSHDSELFGHGLEVFSDSHGYLGTVTEVIETGANLVWSVQGKTYGEILLPVIDDCVLQVDSEKGTAKVHVMKGLIDED